MSFASNLMYSLQKAARMIMVNYYAPTFSQFLSTALSHQSVSMSDATKGRLSNIVHFGLNALTADDKLALRLVLIETGSYEKRDFKQVYFIGSSKTPEQIQATDVGDATTQKEINKVISDATLASLFVLASMSRVPGISGRIDNFFFHPPSLLGKSRVTSHATRVQGLTSVAGATGADDGAGNRRQSGHF